ncbi:Nucleotide-binding universal stress protein, UspA family [Poseidonocella pacifica]|uniref:Nucleotide-binding universal stress protein, UspA family n=1 Tax=Poseidonocella pacifica TaxID=871651 RepID=A0A1I0YSX0_9RHOB|nr:universal stress protein [Poseidonocella pacifica]SFB15540.1 Nucleotide-binding universal stress protein, UspA family [Poseidonocella pacifica]
MAGSKLHSIMLPVRGDGKGDNVLAHAAVLARKFGAHVRVVHCHPAAQDMMPFGVVVPSFLRQQIESAVKSSASSTEDQLREEFRGLIAGMGLKEQERPEPGVATANFCEYVGKQVDAVSHHGRLADLICVAQPDHEQNLGINTLKSALFSSGRPVLVCPDRDTPPATIGRHVAVGWNGSLEASRAVRFSAPFFDSAEEVTILVSGNNPHAATGEELQDYLAHRGVASQIRRFETRGIAGHALLSNCEQIGADLLVMGAYHESYGRETVFGGNSQVVVDETKIPVVMAH